MRISKGLIAATVAGLVVGLAPTMPFDGTGSQDAPPRVSPTEALRAGMESLRGGDKARAVQSFRYAADSGNARALWQLGHMYANGDGVPRDDVLAFEEFKKLVDRNSDVPLSSSAAPYVADAVVALGHYYNSGIPNSPVEANPSMALKMYTHAAAYFGHPDAQYHLGKLLLEGKGVARDPRRAVQWLNLAANKRHYKAQALLGRILFEGELGRQQRASGLMWLIIANDGPGAKIPWIAESHERAFNKASEKERHEALVLLERWIENRP